ncbi:MAG: VUT family protein [Gammaproteobacteria bacterium]|nr:VUT family protein [Gammaproteobacteria bacterium]
MPRTKVEGFVYLAAFTFCIPAANWLIGNLGTVCPNDGPCLIPVAPGVMAPSGVVMVGLALVFRDLVQRRLGRAWAVAAILAGALLSALLAPRALVLASGTAFLLSETADFAVYTPLQAKRLVLAVFLSGAVGVLVDSVVFLYLAFGSLEFLLGQIIGKSWMILFSLPFIVWLRNADARRGIRPA